MTRTLAAALAVSLALAAPAFAKRGNDAIRRYCSGAAATYCGDIDPGSRRMDACFRKHRKALPTKCRRAIDAYRAHGGR